MINQKNMRVLHVIPNAFEYFEDIHSEAFKILEAEVDLGIHVDAVTIDYGGTSKKEISQVKKTAPSRTYVGQETIDKNIEAWDYYDIINLHGPFFGSANKILEWIQKHPEKFLVVTYHHDFVSSDFFSLFIKFYNYYYLPKIFKKANHVAFFADRYGLSKIGIKMLNDEEKVAVLGLPREGEDIHNGSIAQDLVIVYNSLMFN